MTLVERRLLARIVGLAAKIGFGLAWLGIIIHLPRFLELAQQGFDRDRALALALRLSVFVEVAIVLAAPLGAMGALLAVRRSNLFTTLVMGGFRGRHLRRLIFAAAVLTVGASALATEATTAARAAYLARKNRGATLVVRDGGTYAWLLDREDRGRTRRALLFREDALDISYVESVTWSGGDLLVPEARPVIGALVAPERLHPAAAQLDAFVPPATAWWKLRATLAYVNRASVGGILLILACYVALLVPVTRPDLALVTIVFASPAVGLGTMWCVTLLWAYETRGLVAEAGWVALLSLCIVLLDVTYARRGLRAA